MDDNTIKTKLQRSFAGTDEDQKAFLTIKKKSKKELSQNIDDSDLELDIPGINDLSFLDELIETPPDLDIDIPSHPVLEENIGPIGHNTYRSYIMDPAHDWLGLKDTRPYPDKILNIGENREKKTGLSLSADVLLNSPVKEGETSDLKTKKKKATIDPSTVLPVPVPAMTTQVKYRNKNKGILMEELFGDTKILSDDSAVKIGVDSPGPVANTTSMDDDDKKLVGYTPSSATPRRPERRLDTSASSPLATGSDIDLDWLLGTKPSSAAKEPPKPKMKESLRPKTASSSVASTPAFGVPSSTPTVVSSTPNKGIKESKIPDWLEDIVKDTSQKKTETMTTEDLSVNSKNLPDWIGVTSSVAEKQEPPVSEAPQTVQQPSPAKANEGDGNIITKLARVQTELVAAMSKRTENLQIYMQELMHEASRVANVSNVVNINNGATILLEKNQNPSAEGNSKDDNPGGMKKQVEEELRHKDDIIHDLEIKVNRLELLNEQLEMKIQSQLTTHDMEIESLKKGHGFEISVWESRLERMKKTFEEASAEYEGKISKLKEKEAQLIAEHKERIARLEEERLEDLTKLGEFHRLAMEQAAVFTIQSPNINQTIRLPLRGLQRPKDEVELSERETALMEKERQIELLKATLEAQRKELDEALQVEKIRREDRERDMRRQANETRLREEAWQAEAKREREQLDSMALQIKIMRDEALKEQGEIAKDKLELAAERARLEATYSIQGRTEASLPPLDIMQARAEVEAALEIARQAKEAAEMERRRQAEMRQSVEQISWEQKEMDIRLENREKHVNEMLKSAEKLRNEGLAAIDEAKAMKEKMENNQREMKEQLRQIENKERFLAKERLEIAKEKIELERRKTQLELILPELDPAEDLTIHPPKGFIDPKAVIMRLKAEKELESFMTTRK